MSSDNNNNKNQAPDLEKSAETADHTTKSLAGGDASSFTKPNTDSEGVVTFEIDQNNLPPGYFTSSFFIGTLAACGLGLYAGTAGFGYAAPILTIINNDIGPNPDFIWVALSYTLTTAVTLTIVGRVSDIFGRRWVFVGGAVLGTVGSIVCATAQNINSLIGGTAIIGIGAATQLSYYYVMGELVPMKYRLLGNAYCYIFGIPGSGTSAAVGHAFMLNHPNVGWRGGYYILIAMNAVALACWYLFYHPPTFHMKHPGARMAEYVKNFDYVGTTLYTGGALIFLMGLNWGGRAFPWASAHVITTITLGFVALVIFVLWETFRNLKEPLVPMKLFRNKGWNAATAVSGLGAAMFYAFSIVWPRMVAELYTHDNVMHGAWLACLPGISISVGEIIGGILARPIGWVKWQCTIAFTMGGILYGLMALCTPESQVLAACLIWFGTFFTGWGEGIAITAVTLTPTDQNQLGTASGVAGSLRFMISSIATTVYNVVLSHRLATTIPAQVPPVLASVGLPESSIPEFMLALPSKNFEGISGVNSTIIEAGMQAYRVANADAFRTVFYTSIAFTASAVLCSLLIPDLDVLLTDKVASTLHKGPKDERMAAT